MTEDRDHNLAGLSLEDKIALLSGASLWRTPALDSKGFPALKMSDGPHGVRGDGAVGGTRFPCGSVLGSTWDPDLLEALGAALGREARAKAVSILLGPTINLQRTLLGGRNFEAYSEDPELTAALGEAFVRGVQSEGVAACPKHFVTNDCETERHSVSVEVDPQTLAECYLYPFERAVRVGGAWAIMAAYHRLGGTYCAAHRGLLTEILRERWGFDGVVVSDWGGTYETVGPVLAGLDIEMPGPPKVRGAKLAEALAEGAVEEQHLDASLQRVKRLAERTAESLDAEAPEGPGGGAEHDALAERLALGGMVLLKNEAGFLPREGVRAPRSIALLGPNGETPQYQGGGSSALKGHRASSPEAGLRAAFPEAEITVAPGLRTPRYAPLVPAQALTGVAPEGGPWALAFAASATGAPVKTRSLRRSELMLFGADPELPQESWVTLESRFTAWETGTHRFSLISAGPAVLEVDGALVVDNDTQWRPGDAFFSYGSEEAFGDIVLEAGQSAKLCVRYRWDSAIPFAGVRLGLHPPEPRDLWAEALAAAEAAELAVVVVGLDAQWESEGADRKDFALPGAQSAFIRAVAERNPRTVVVVNAGSAVETASWADAVPAILWLGYPGQAFGAALGQVLAGEAEPRGRLAMSWPRRAEDHPTARHSRPEAGTLIYAEGRKLGYRAFPEPAFPFGFGLGYTPFTLALGSLALVERAGVEGVAVTVTLQNQGERAGSTVVQCYGEAETPEPWGPRRLLGFQRVALAARAQATVTLFLPLARLALFDAEDERWWLPGGPYRFALGFSSQDLAVEAPLTLPARESVPREGAA